MGSNPDAGQVFAYKISVKYDYHRHSYNCITAINAREQGNCMLAGDEMPVSAQPLNWFGLG